MQIVSYGWPLFVLATYLRATKVSLDNLCLAT
ncbi:putative tail protein [Klebsiella phage vB_KpnS_Uniso31]|uniref:Tail protein n=1 Tax=Klebsiella phage vB_KpnS_Uniso31 TaxID=2951200 RepID=A0A9E7NGP4_9CAUD|nr:putative tail protein [Klebsiella phage vB_KpnS_Uniso31]